MDVFSLVAVGQRAYLRGSVVRAAEELELAEVLPATAEAAVRKLGLRSPRRLRRLLDALAVLDEARREGDVFHLRERPRAPATAGAWGRIAEIIRADRPVVVPADEGSLRRLHGHLQRAGADAARELWAKLPEARGPMLDLGGGAGTYTAAFLQAHPGEEAAIADKPEVLELVAVSRARLLPIDLLASELPKGQRVILLANVLHLFGESDCRRILAKAAAALAPDGLLIVKDLLVEPDRSGPAEGVLFALNLALFTSEGDVHDPLALASWMRAAGLREPRRVPLAGSLALAAASP
jgi:hypothetical protein